jgi:glutamate 5-kinase
VPVARPLLSAARRVVIKLGTRVITHDDGRLALARLFEVVEAAAGAARGGREVLIVSSGAVGLGRDALGLSVTPTALAERQACAAVGQVRLMDLYQGGFSRLGLTCAQVLLTEGDLDDRLRYLNLRSTLLALLRHGVVPVLNENDAVSTEELAWDEGVARPVFGDNDRLSALVATKLSADLLVLLTDVGGLYDRDPRTDPAAGLIDRIGPEGEGLPRGLSGTSGTDGGRGGMASKVEAARIAARSGCQAIIASGRTPGALAAALAGDAIGTWFEARPGLSARGRWIAFAAAPRGSLVVDAGAARALVERGASLLAVGVVDVRGEFSPGDVVEVVGPGGDRLARGLVHVDAATARRWASGSPPAGVRNHDALLHRDHLVLESA